MLLDTALVLIARDGESALTLGGVADEAGIARATVYGYFTGKKDLLAALDEAGHVSDMGFGAVPAPATEATQPEVPADHQNETVVAAADYASSATAKAEQQAEFTFAAEPASPPEIEPVTGSEESVAEAQTAEELITAAQLPETVDGVTEHSANEVAEPQIEEAGAVTDVSEAAAPVTQIEPAIDTPISESLVEGQREKQVLAAETSEEELTPFEHERRLQATHLEEIAKRLILPESALKEGTDAVISRLDTRLRVLERSITGLETRQNAIPDETAKKVKPVSDIVAQLQNRADAMEDRQRQSLAELRLSIHELTARQSALGASPGSVPETPVWPEPAAAPVEAVETRAKETEAEKSEEQIAADNARSAYLSTARNLAKEGARQAAERESQFEEDRRRRRRQLLTAAGVAGVCLVAVGALFVFRPGPHGVSVAQSKSIARTTQPKNVFTSVAPLDRLTALANKGDVRAEVVVGLKYLKGDGVPASEKDAARWFERAAKSGNAAAENHLGALYQAGRGVPADVHLAMHWYEAAAMQGDRHAMSNLAVLYAGGTGGTKNFAEAARWFQRSAELGFVDAQFNLAVLFERGDGVPQSLLDAYKWYTIAAASGDPVAKARAEAIETQVSPEELQAAQLVAAKFQPRPLNAAANDVPTMADVLASR